MTERKHWNNQLLSFSIYKDELPILSPGYMSMDGLSPPQICDSGRPVHSWGHEGGWSVFSYSCSTSSWTSRTGNWIQSSTGSPANKPIGYYSILKCGPQCLTELIAWTSLLQIIHFWPCKLTSLALVLVSQRYVLFDMPSSQRLYPWSQCLYVIQLSTSALLNLVQDTILRLTCTSGPHITQGLILCTIQHRNWHSQAWRQWETLGAVLH